MHELQSLRHDPKKTMEEHKLLSRSLLLLLILLPFIRSDNCVVRRDYMNVRHALKIPYYYDSYSDSYIYGTKIQCAAITLSGNKTVESYIKAENLEQAKITQLIYISNSDLPTIEAGAFDPYNRIRKLLIGKNGIKNIKPFVFSDMANLTDIQLYENNLSEMEENTFDGCTSLKILNLANNKITSLKNLNIPSLQKLHVENNLLSSISVKDFQNLKGLRTLNLSSNSISLLEDNLFDNLVNFTEFSISYNRISYVPVKLFKNSMSRVDMSHNKIRSINCNKFNGVVDLSYNELTTFSNFVNSTSINLSNNKISALTSESFKGLNKLRSLNLHHNNIAEIHVNAFFDLFNLTTLNLSQNAISNIPIGTFHTLIDLEELDLSNNKLETFVHGTFTGLSSLENLDLSNNRIQTLDEKVLYSLHELAILNLRGNFIQRINVKNFASHLPDLRYLSIDFGKIGCDTLMQMMYFFKERYIRVQKGNAVNVHNINGIACDPNLHEDPFSEDNSTEIVEITTIQNDNKNNYNIVDIANAMSNIHTILVLACVFFILFLIIKSVVLIRQSFRLCRRTANMPSCSLKLLSENE